MAFRPHNGQWYYDTPAGSAAQLRQLDPEAGWLGGNLDIAKGGHAADDFRNNYSGQVLFRN